MGPRDNYRPNFSFAELVAAIKSSFVSDRFDDSTLVIVPDGERGHYRYSTKPLWRRSVSGKGNPEYEEFRIEFFRPSHKGYPVIHIDMHDNTGDNIYAFNIPQVISGLMILFEEFDEAERSMVAAKEKLSKPRIQDYLPDGVPALLERLFADSDLQYDFSVYHYKSVLELWIRLPYKRIAYYQIPLSASEDEIKVAIDASKEIKALVSRYKGKVEVSGYHYNYHRWKGKDPDDKKK